MLPHRVGAESAAPGGEEGPQPGGGGDAEPGGQVAAEGVGLDEKDPSPVRPGSCKCGGCRRDPRCALDRGDDHDHPGWPDVRVMAIWSAAA